MSALLDRIELNCLRAFVLVAECGSVTLASHRVGRTQPAVSLQIKRLEEALGCELFYRYGRRLVLSDDGHNFVGFAKNILQTIEAAKATVGQSVVTGRVVLGTPDLYAAYLLPNIIRRFSRAYPQVQLELRCEVSSKLLRLLDRGEVDVALVTGRHGRLGGRLARHEQLVWAASVEHHLELQDPLSLAMVPPGNLYRDLALRALDAARRGYQIVAVSESFGGLQAAVFAGLAITVVGRSSLAHGLREITVDEGLPELPSVDLIVHHRDEAAKSITSLADYLIKSLNAGAN